MAENRGTTSEQDCGHDDNDVCNITVTWIVAVAVTTETVTSSQLHPVHMHSVWTYGVVDIQVDVGHGYARQLRNRISPRPTHNRPTHNTPIKGHPNKRPFQYSIPRPELHIEGH